MALPFFELLGIEPLSLPDGGIYDPNANPIIPDDVEVIVRPTTLDEYDVDSPSVAPAPTVEEESSEVTISGSETIVVNGRIVNRITFSNGETFDQDLGPEGGYGFTAPTTTPTTTTPGQQQGSTDPNSPNYNPQQAQRQSAFEVLKERFTRMGLGSLALEIESIFKGTAKTKAGSPIPIPTSESGFYLALIETEAYYKRFGAVNEARTKAGYTALDERTILGMEDQYQKTMKAYGMPAGFYDTPEDFQKFIENDLSGLELADRLQAARQFTSIVNPEIKAQLKNNYNIDESMLAAYVADPNKGQQILNQLATKSLTGAAAILSGLTQEAATRAEAFGAGEMRFGEQMQRFGQASTLAERGGMLSQITAGEQAFGEQQAVEATFGGLEQSVRAAERLASKERARFGGRAGAITSAFTSPTAGQF